MNYILIGVILGIILLLFIIIAIICCYRYNRGGKYPVYEKERLHGIPDEDEESNAKDFGRPDDMPSKRRKGGSIDSKGNLIDSETDSLAEYDEDPDPNTFGEDGSFIGQYGGDKVPETPDINPPNALSTFV
ncbi:DgyrCDS4991 [Dimorphilus gyrociliatus]|uniref:DgyrCDS4991 n=1 Tax=Dimorphilus gyrociliatus TaxID=2664684 RepID=A0A7I8VK10_9ANNE|nr:DgyrCDS4991 [Dimorphilus gyrociliatus]